MGTGPPPQTQTEWLCVAMEQALSALNVLIDQQGAVIVTIQDLKAVTDQLIIFDRQGVFMATIRDLKTAADQLVANESALGTQVGNLATAVQALEAAYTNLKTTTTLSAADQTQMDQAIAEVTNAASDLATQTQTLAADTTGAQDAVTPPAA